MKRKDNIFKTTAVLAPTDRNYFDLSHERKTSFQIGKLVPTLCIPALPGDRISLNMVNMLRTFPLVAPVMHKMRVTTDLFFCPYRILWSGFTDFIGGLSDDVLPFITLDDTVAKGSILQHLGIPAGDYSNHEQAISALPIAAYYKIYDEWYRKQYLIDEKFTPLVAGDNTATYYPGGVAQPPLVRCWEHDLFTSALDEAQLGDPVSIPLTFQNDIPVDFTATPGLSNAQVVYDLSTGLPSTILGALANGPGPAPIANSLHQGAVPVALAPPLNGAYTVDVQSQAALLDDLREAWALQGLLQIMKRGGTRYTEQLRSIWNVEASDKSLQRPELIGRVHQTMTISEVLATAQDTDPSAPVAIGTMGGHAISVGGSKDNLEYYAEEHGVFIAIISLLPDTAYMDGIPKHFQRFDWLDWPNPHFAHLGDEPVLLREVKAHGLSPTDDPLETFGYQMRYAQERYHPSTCTGEMTDTLLYWHLGRQFTNTPALNAEFVECRVDEGITRIFANTSDVDDQIIAHLIYGIEMSRMLPRFAIPPAIR